MKAGTKHFSPLRRTFTIGILALLLPALVVLALSDYLLSNADLHASFETQRRQADASIREGLGLVYAGYRILNMALDERMKTMFKQFHAAWEKAGRDPSRIDLEALKKSFGGKTDLYIIDEHAVIRYTTYPKDMGLDFKKISPNFAERLQKIREGNVYVPDMFMRETQGQVIRKYAYYPTQDHKWILELGMVSDEFASYLKELDDANVIERLKRVNPSIVSIQYYSNDGRRYDGVYADASTLERIKHVVANPDTFIEVSDPEGSCILSYFFVNLHHPDVPTDLSKVVEVAYSLASIKAALVRKTQLAVTIIFFVAVLGSILAFILASSLSKPIHRLIVSIDAIAKGDLDYPVTIGAKNELRVLEESIVRMMATMKEYIKRIIDSEAEVKKYSEQLEKLVDERTKKLLEQARYSSLGMLVGGVAHEINTPVGVCVTASSFLADETRRITEQFQCDMITKTKLEQFFMLITDFEKILQENLMRTVNLVNTFKQVAVDRLSDTKRTFNLKEYIEVILLSLKSELEEHKPKIVIEIDSSIEVITYPGYLSQILTNIIQNSLHHAWEAGCSGTIRITAHLENRNLVLRVADNGRGIDPEQRELVFEPFVTTARSRGSMGLGLTIVHNLVVQKLGGSVEIEDVPGCSIRIEFVVEIPDMQHAVKNEHIAS